MPKVFKHFMSQQFTKRSRGYLLGEALRIYLIVSLNEATTKLKQLQLDVQISSAGNRTRLATALIFAEKIIQYIKNCQADDTQNLLLTSSGIIGLAAIDRAQQALVLALKAARGNLPQDLCNLTMRGAKYIVNSLIAEREGNTELSSLWALATRNCEMIAADPFMARAIQSIGSYSQSCSNTYNKTAQDLFASGVELDKEAGMLYLEAHKHARRLHVMHIVQQLQTLNPEGVEDKGQLAESEMRATDALCNAYAEIGKLLHSIAPLLVEAEERKMFVPLLLFLSKVGKDVAQHRLVQHDFSSAKLDSEKLIPWCARITVSTATLLSKIHLLLSNQSTSTEAYTRIFCQ